MTNSGAKPSWILGVALALLASVLLMACDGQDAGGKPGQRGGGGPGPGAGGYPTGPTALVSDWIVTTTLVAASDPTNPKYKAGDIRAESWRIASQGGALTLTTPNGTIPGRAQGSSFVFEGGGDTGLNLRIHAVVDGQWTGRNTIAGKIKVRYFGTFNNYVGFDSLTYEGTRR